MNISKINFRHDRVLGVVIYVAPTLQEKAVTELMSVSETETCDYV